MQQTHLLDTNQDELVPGADISVVRRCVAQGVCGGDPDGWPGVCGDIGRGMEECAWGRRGQRIRKRRENAWV
jgi:hypothetical protein